jgi:hypothetical protein
VWTQLQNIFSYHYTIAKNIVVFSKRVRLRELSSRHSGTGQVPQDATGAGQLSHTGGALCRVPLGARPVFRILLVKGDPSTNRTRLPSPLVPRNSVLFPGVASFPTSVTGCHWLPFGRPKTYINSKVVFWGCTAGLLLGPTK